MCRAVISNSNTTSIITISQDGSTSSIQRSVRFSPSDDHKHIEPDFHLTDDDLDNIWWTQDELDQSCLERTESLLKHGENSDLLEQSFSELYKHCSSSLTISQVMRTKAAKHILSVASSDDLDLRGLEAKFSKWVSKRRKYHAQSVIQQQQQQKQQQGGGESPISPVTGVSLLKTSKASEMVARLLAHADARQARAQQ